MTLVSRLLVLSLIATYSLTGFAAADSDSDDDSDSVQASSYAKEFGGKSIGNIQGNVGLTSDYVFRGQSQTDHQPAIQGGLDWVSPQGIYLGAWGSNVHFAEGPAALELDVYGGFDYPIAKDWLVGTGVVYYSYFRGAEGNNWAIPLKVSWKQVKAELDFSPKLGVLDGQSWYVSLGWADKVIYDITFGAAVGYSFFADTIGYANYADFRLAVSREFLTVNWELATTFVNHRQFNDVDATRVIFTASKTF